ncbi:MAG: hypothetical protein ACRC92_27440 [Peptostreptococcaceae bacterium]
MEIVCDYIFGRVSDWIMAEFRTLSYLHYIDTLDDYYEHNFGILLENETEEEKVKIINKLSNTNKLNKEHIAEELTNKCIKELLKKEKEDIIYTYFTLLERNDGND